MAVAIPDFGALASQQKTLNDQATNQTNQANRVNQYDPYGSLTWSQDGSGNWTQSTNLSGQSQGLFDSDHGRAAGSLRTDRRWLEPEWVA